MTDIVGDKPDTLGYNDMSFEGQAMTTQTTNLRESHFVVPQSNEWSPTASILPARFTSTSEPISDSIVSAELGSLSDVKPHYNKTSERDG